MGVGEALLLSGFVCCNLALGVIRNPTGVMFVVLCFWLKIQNSSSNVLGPLIELLFYPLVPNHMHKWCNFDMIRLWTIKLLKLSHKESTLYGICIMIAALQVLKNLHPLHSIRVQKGRQKLGRVTVELKVVPMGYWIFTSSFHKISRLVFLDVGKLKKIHFS